MVHAPASSLGNKEGAGRLAGRGSQRKDRKRADLGFVAEYLQPISWLCRFSCPQHVMQLRPWVGGGGEGKRNSFSLSKVSELMSIRPST